MDQAVGAGAVTAGAAEIVPSRRVQANRENARHSTGPRTLAGRARSRLNAVRHGILTREVFDAEDPKGRREFQRLFDRFSADLAPVGPLEELLVERIVTCACRLARVLRAEAGAVNVRVDDVGIACDEFPLDDESDPTPAVERAGSSYAIDMLLGELGRIRDRIEAGAFLRGDELDYFERIFASRPHVLGAIKSRSEAALAEHRAAALTELINIETDLRSTRETFRKRERLECKYRRAAAAIPDDATVATLLRYESAVERQFYRALHELERLQARRRGEPVLPPFHVDVEG